MTAVPALLGRKGLCGNIMSLLLWPCSSLHAWRAAIPGLLHLLDAHRVGTLHQCTLVLACVFSLPFAPHACHFGLNSHGQTWKAIIAL